MHLIVRFKDLAIRINREWIGKVTKNFSLDFDPNTTIRGFHQFAVRLKSTETLNSVAVIINLAFNNNRIKERRVFVGSAENFGITRLNTALIADHIEVISAQVFRSGIRRRRSKQRPQTQQSDH